MNLLSKILAGIIILILTFLAYQEIKYSKEISRTEAKLEASLDHIDSLETAKTYVDTIHDTVYRTHRVFIKDPKPVDSFRVYADIYRKYVKIDGEDTLIEYKEEFVYDKTYEEEVTTDDFRMNLLINARGRINWVRSSEYTLFDKTINTSHVVNVPKPVFTEYKRSHLYLYFHSGNNMKSLSSWNTFSAGLRYMHKTIWGINAGYQRTFDEDFIIVGIDLKLL